jgi:hypothetical protein
MDRLDRAVIAAVFVVSVVCMIGSLILGGMVGGTIYLEARNYYDCSDVDWPHDATESTESGSAVRGQLRPIPLGVTCIFEREGGGEPIVVYPPAWQSVAGYSALALFVGAILMARSGVGLVRTLSRTRRG